MVRAQGTKKSIFFFWNIAVCVFLFTRFNIKIYVQDKGRKKKDAMAAPQMSAVLI